MVRLKMSFAIGRVTGLTWVTVDEQRMDIPTLFCAIAVQTLQGLG
jgi:hypothetical protein